MYNNNNFLKNVNKCFSHFFQNIFIAILGWTLVHLINIILVESGQDIVKVKWVDKEGQIGNVINISGEQNIESVEKDFLIENYYF